MLIVSDKNDSLDFVLNIKNESCGRCINETKKSDQFEIDVADYLNKEFSKTGLTFKPVGKSNSQTSDIVVLRGENSTGEYIECKMAKAQAAHFTLDEIVSDGKVIGYKYQGSLKNNKYDIAIKTIVNYINDNIKKISEDKYLRLSEAYIDEKDANSQTATEIHADNTIQSSFDKAIIRHYRNKHVKFVASGNSGKNPVILKLENFAKYFDIAATFRVLPSGSRDIPKYRVKEIVSTMNYYEFYTGDKLGTNLKRLTINGDSLFADGVIIQNKNQLGKCLYAKLNKPIDDRVAVPLSTGNIYLVFQMPVQGYAKVRLSSYKDNDDSKKPSVNFSVYLRDDVNRAGDIKEFKAYINRLVKSTK